MEWVAGKEFTEFIESQSNKMKRNIKIRVTLEQSIKIQEICFENGIIWAHKVRQLTNLHLPFLFICKKEGIYATSDIEYYNSHTEYQEIDADLFIRTNGTCEETFKEQQSYNDGDLIIKDDNIHIIGKVINKHNHINTLEQKLKKKNEILKKARIKRKNQREELHKLNLKLQKSIGLEEHHQVVDELRKDINFRNETIKNTFQISKDRLKEIEELNKQIEKINKDNVNYLSNNILSRDKEIEKLKAVIEYLESKVK